jgi:hypothetical protein
MITFKNQREGGHRTIYADQASKKIIKHIAIRTASRSWITFYKNFNVVLTNIYYSSLLHRVK